jgi:hypothetical protein
MPDEADIAQDAEERHLGMAMAMARGISGPAACGRCLFCGETAPEPALRWCDAWCRDQWQRERDAAPRNTRVAEDDA